MLPLALKYRPKTLDSVIGQDLVVSIIKSAINKQKISSAIILTGIRGTGKTSLARIIAKAVNCSSETKPCLHCESCTSLENGSNIDILEIDAASNTGVDDIRSIIESCQYKPAISSHKVFIIDEVHMLSKSAFNALLKTLEEPPAHVKFIFATTEIEKVPDTIISRCLRLDLKRVPNIELTQYLAKIASEENISVDFGALQLVASYAEGSVRDALSILNQIFYLPQPIRDSDVADLLGITGNSVLLVLLDYLLHANVVSAVNEAKKIYNNCNNTSSIFNGLLEMLHFMMCTKSGVTSMSDYFMQDEIKQKLKSYSTQVTIPSINQIWQVILKGMAELDLTIDESMTLEMTLIRICYLSNLPDLADFLNKLDKKTDQNITSLDNIIARCADNSALSSAIRHNVDFDYTSGSEIYLLGKNDITDKLKDKIKQLLPEYAIFWDVTKNGDDANLLDKALTLFPNADVE